MESEISHVKRARLLSQNQIREIVMDSDDNEKYYIYEDTEDDEPCPPSRRSSISEPPSPDFSASSSEDEDDVGNMAGQQPQPCLWTLPPQPRRCVVHTFTGAPNGKSKEAAHIMSKSTPLSILLLFFKDKLFKILQPFRIFGNRWSHREIQGKDTFQTVHPEKTQTFRHQNVQTVWLYRIYIWHECLPW